MKIDVEGDLPSPSGRGQGEGLSICIDLRPSPAAARRPLPEGEVMPRMHAPRATFCEKSPSLKFCPASVRQQPLKARVRFRNTVSISWRRTRAEARDYIADADADRNPVIHLKPRAPVRPPSCRHPKKPTLS